MENITIRRVEAKDAEFLFHLMNDESILDSLNEVAAPLDGWRNNIARMKNEAPDEEDHIILDGGVPIGWLGVNGLASQNKQAWIKIIAILPDKQGLGIGPHVISRLKERLKLRGYERLALYTDRANVIAQKCYRTCGFVITDTFMRKMANGKCVERYKMEAGLK